MASIVDRVNKLIALAASSNAHEARNAAHLAAKLIREHGLELKETRPARTTPTPRKTPQTTERASRRTSSKKNLQVPPIIESPLGGDCASCGKRYRAGTEIHWSDADGGIHTACIDTYMARRSKR